MRTRAALCCLLSLPLLAQRSISFSGCTWTVKSSNGELGSPGPCYFSDSKENVWVDARGRLHLRVVKSGDRWYCSEIVNTESRGFGAYRFYLESRVDHMDPSVVLGLFTWNNAPEYNHREIDIEFSRWGDPARPTNAQYVVQPAREDQYVAFRHPAVRPTVQSIEWRPDVVHTSSVRGRDAATTRARDRLATHTFTSGIPLPGGENARINLWLKGAAPLGGKSVEVIVRRFEHIP